MATLGSDANGQLMKMSVVAVLETDGGGECLQVAQGEVGGGVLMQRNDGGLEELRNFLLLPRGETPDEATWTRYLDPNVHNWLRTVINDLIHNAINCLSD